LNEESYNSCRSVELSSFLSCTISKVFEKVLVCGTEKIRKFKVFVSESVFGEVDEESLELLIRDCRFSFLRIEINMLENSF
jgi:hypothetical protein